MRPATLPSFALALAVTSSNLSAATPTQDETCLAFSELFDAASEDPAFSTLSEKFAAGSAIASFTPQEALGARDGKDCRLMNMRGRGRVLACYFGAEGYSETGSALGKGLAAKRHYTALLQNCGLLSGFRRNEDPDPITDIWTSEDRSKTVTLKVTGIEPGNTAGLQFTLTAR